MTENAAEEATYSVVRFYQESHPELVIAEGLSLEEAQDWCRSPQTSSATATDADAVAHTDQYGPWFDGWTAED